MQLSIFPGKQISGEKLKPEGSKQNAVSTDV